MKKVLLFLFAISLFVACSDDDDKDPKKEIGAFGEKPTNKIEVGIITAKFKLLKLANVAGLKAGIAESAVADMESWAKQLATIKLLPNEAQKDIAGKLGKRQVNGRGVETEQLIHKGLIGAFQLNGFNKCAMEGVGAADAKARREALNKAVAYLFTDLNLDKTKDQFKEEGNGFGKYMMSVSSSVKYKDINKSIITSIKTAYEKADEKETYKAELMKILGYANTVVAFRAVHYLGEYANKIREEGGMTGETGGTNVHELSEGLGFAYSLAFAMNAKTHSYYLTHEKAKSFTAVNLWDEATDKSGESLLDKGAAEIAELFGFSVADAM